MTRSAPFQPPFQRLYINIDHVATIREARRTDEPDPVEAAIACEAAGANGITAHLREDRRHIQDHDVERLVAANSTAFNLEMACTDEMLAIAERLRPFQVTFVPEKRAEVTTEGGLDVTHDPRALERAMVRMRTAGIRSAVFIDPDATMVQQSHDLGADAIELHTGSYAHHPNDPLQLQALREAASLGNRLSL
ncbi:MAG: pyridoxine 5'-phosphate synthase, partial [Gemmatimonadota bacterium]